MSTKKELRHKEIAYIRSLDKQLWDLQKSNDQVKAWEEANHRARMVKITRDVTDKTKKSSANFLVRKTALDKRRLEMLKDVEKEYEQELALLQDVKARILQKLEIELKNRELHSLDVMGSIVDKFVQESKVAEDDLRKKIAQFKVKGLSKDWKGDCDVPSGTIIYS